MMQERFNRICPRMSRDWKSHCQRRGVDWEYLHIYVDYAFCIGITAIFLGLKTTSTVAFLSHAVASHNSVRIPQYLQAPRSAA